MNSGVDYIEELKEGFRISETQLSGNESAFKSILNEVREYKKNLSKQQDDTPSQYGSVSTQNSWHVSRQSFQNNQDNLQSLIEMETIKQNQFYAVINTMERKITDYKKKTDKINELLEGFNLDDAAAKQESQQSSQLLQQSKKNAIAANEYLQLLKNSQNLKKQSLLDKHEAVLQEIKELQEEYSEYRQVFQQKSEIIQQQRQVIHSLEESKSNLEQKQNEQQTVVCYANTIKLMDEMFHKNDPRKLFDYRFEQRQQIIQQKRKQSQVIMNIFATQIEFDEIEQPIATQEEETDQMILEMIKQSANLNELDIQMDLLAFAEVVIQKYQEYKEQFDRLGFQFILLNERKYDLEQQVRETVHFKYQETSNGLLPIKLNDNFNSKQVTLNILSTSVELDLTEQRTEQEVKRVQNAVIRLFHFVKNHVARTNHLVKHIQEISELVPSSVFIVINELKNTVNVNEIIRTPAPKKPSVLVSQVLDQKSEFLHSKNQKLTQKTMLSTTYLPKKQIHSPSTKFKYFRIVQKFIKSLLSDEIERLFVQQDMIDELTREVQKHCEQTDPNEEALIIYLKTKQIFFEHRLQQRTREMIKNAFSKLGDVYNKLKYECSQLRLKGLDFTEKKFKSGCIFNQRDQQLQSDKRSASNQFVSSQQSFDNTIDQSEHSRAKGGKDVFHLLKKLTNVNDIQEAGQQESEDSIDKERVKFKQQNYYIKSQIFAKDQSQKNLDDDVFYRLNPQRTNPNKQTRNQLGILRHMRISNKQHHLGAARSSCSIDQDLKTEIWKMTCPVQPNIVKTRKDTFRKLFNSSEKKLTDLQTQKKVQTRSFNMINLPRSTYTTSDDVESVWKKKYRAKKILNAISAKENKKERFGILEAI